jgi:hypothetical protein
MRHLAVASCLLFLAGTSATQETTPARERFEHLRAQLHQSHAGNDWQANLQSARKLKALLNEAPRSLLEVARAEMHVGDTEGALRELAQFARMGQSADLPAISADFSALVTTAAFKKIQTDMSANNSAVSLASPAFLLSDAGLVPEDIDYDAHSKRFFITSVRERKIISLDLRGSSTEFARAPEDWPMLALKVDSARYLVWATEVALKGFNSVPEADWGRSALLCYELKTGRLLRRIEAPRPSALGDMVLTRRGEVIVSDGDGGGVYRLPVQGTTLQRLDGGDFISPQTPAMHPDGKHIFVADYLRGIGVLDVATRQVRWLPMAGRFALNGIDGLYFERGRLIAVQNGTTPERVAVFTLDASLSRIVAEKVVERSTDTLGDPTHGVTVDDRFYYIANSGWDLIDDHGNLKPGAKPSAPRIMQVQLSGF